MSPFVNLELKPRRERALDKIIRHSRNQWISSRALAQLTKLTSQQVVHLMQVAKLRGWHIEYEPRHVKVEGRYWIHLGFWRITGEESLNHE